MPRHSRPPLGTVNKEGGVWHWTCRIPLCHQAHHRWTHPDALADLHRHLLRHRFGFRP